jgi:RimJ/RimL family protein N-acetyltransferase
MTLEGDVVRLELLESAHIEALAEIGLDPDLWRLTITHLATVADMCAYVEQAQRDWERGTALPFAIRHRATGRLVGSTRLAAIDARHRRAEIGWTWVAREWQRTAVNTEAKLLLLRHAFEVMRCNRVEFKTDVLNERSRAALWRIGAREEGVLRRHMVTDTGRVRDTVYFSIIVDEWPRVAEALQARLRAVLPGA